MNSLETLLSTIKQNHFLAEKLKAKNEVFKIQSEKPMKQDTTPSIDAIDDK